jgi:glutamate/tyrosine decarboxylase-like PLP-dependent enzyme
MSNIKSVFLGPKAENLDFFEKVICDIVRDTAFLRRNYQPDDKTLITEKNKLSFTDESAVFHQNLQSILSELKKCVPTYHPRHIGHMNADILMSGIAGFLSGMFYNPNNIINVASPSSTNMEVKYIDMLCKMVGYKEIAAKSKPEQGKDNTAWGHLCSGGTSANIEALWALRNLKYYPVSVKLAINEKNLNFLNDKILIDGKKIEDYDYTDLFTIPVKEIYNIKEQIDIAIKNHIQAADISDGEVVKFYNDNIKPYTVQEMGVAHFHNKTGLPFPKVYVSYTRHYSWEKAMDVIGLGRENLVFVKTNKDFQLDIDDLNYKIKNLDEEFKKQYPTYKQYPTLAVISIMGTTEEGAIDPLDKILGLDKEIEKNINKANDAKSVIEHNKPYFIHIDAAYGGYFASFLDYENLMSDIVEFVVKTAKDEINPVIQSTEKDNEKRQKELFEKEERIRTILSKYFLFGREWTSKVYALRYADSITIDPHKLGYIPYPAGAVLFRDYRSRLQIRFDAPYVTKENSKLPPPVHLGNWTLEGSRSGAAAVACYLSGQTVPLNREGQGKMLAYTVLSATHLLKSMDDFNENKTRNRGFQVIPLFKTDTNAVCYIISNEKIIKSPKLLNMFTNAIVNELTIIPEERIIPDYKFIVSTSDWEYNTYKHIIDGILTTGAHIDAEKLKELNGQKLDYIRSIMMNPMAAFVDDNYYDKYFDLIAEIANKALGDVLFSLMKEYHQKGNKINNNRRIRLLWIEDDREIDPLKDIIEQDNNFGRYFNINFVDNITDIEKIKKNDADAIRIKDYDIAILDLNFHTNDHSDKKERDYGCELANICKKNIDVIVYSNFLVGGAVNSRREQIKQETFAILKSYSIPDYCCIPKSKKTSDGFEHDKPEIVNAILKILQTKKQINNG